jgi:hypothetical protein
MHIGTVGVVGAAQVEAAMRLLPIQVRYMVTLPSGVQRAVDFRGVLNKNRSAPMLVPRIKTKYYRIATFAKVDDIRAYFKGAERCASRNSAVAHIVLPQLDPVSETFLEDTDDPTLGAGMFGGRPLTEQDYLHTPEGPPDAQPQAGAGDAGQDGGEEADELTPIELTDTLGVPMIQDARDRDVQWATYLAEMRKYNMIQEDLPLPENLRSPSSTVRKDRWNRAVDGFAIRAGTTDVLEKLRGVPLNQRHRMARVGAAFHRYFAEVAHNRHLQEYIERTAAAYDGLAQATASCPALDGEEYAQWTGFPAPRSYTSETVKKFLIAGADLIDAIGASRDMRAVAADRIERAGERLTAQRLIEVVEDMKREARESREAMASRQATATAQAAVPDMPGEEQAAEDFGPATSHPASRPSSPAPPVGDVAAEAGMSTFVMQFSDPSASHGQTDS